MYWAYGSNMSGRQLAARCPGAVAVSPAWLEGYRVAFDRPSRRWGGHAADVVPAPGAIAWGVLWDIPADGLAALDVFEGVASGAYERFAVTVTRPRGERVHAVTYRVCSPGTEGAPSARYLHVILEGARQFGLPAEYVALLRGRLRAG